jgi:hypothetical protein
MTDFNEAIKTTIISGTQKRAGSNPTKKIKKPLAMPHV